MDRRLVHDVMASLAITITWVAVMFDALFGPSIETSNSAGTNTSSVPSAVVLSIFAFLTSWVIARNAFGREPGEKR
jgi:hypothetical protein